MSGQGVDIVELPTDERGRTPVDDCPGCGADLLGEPRPNGGRYSAATGVLVRGVVVLWQCPHCRHRWHRFGPESGWHALAEPWIRKRADR